MRSLPRLSVIVLALALAVPSLASLVAPALAQGPCDSTRSVPYWWTLRPAAPCNGDSVAVVFGSCRDCVDLAGYEWADRNSGRLRVDVRMPARCPLTLVCRPDSVVVPLGRFAAGAFTLAYDLHVAVAAGDSSAACEFTRPASLSFRVGCDTPPSCDTLPSYVQVVQIGPPVDCNTADCIESLCPGVPIPLHLSGTFTDGCWSLAGIDLVPGPEAGLRASPPIVRLRVTRRTCTVCTMALVPWSADTTLPGLPGGRYELRLEVVRRDVCGGAVVDSLVCRDHRGFAIKDSCGGTVSSCVVPGWVHPDGSCDDTVVSGGRATVVMTATSAVPLAGLQGTIHLAPHGLRVADLVPVGRAADMHLAWERTANGAEFVMFAEQGTPIGGLRCTGGTRCSEPVLAVSVLPDTDAVLPAVTRVTVHELLGADSLGGEVPACEVEAAARVCSGVSCDFNGDGRLDVRDLVVMVHCVLGNGPCPDSTLARYDCNADGASNVDDVLCCARRLLRGGERDSLPGRSEPHVAVQFGDPVWQGGELRVPVRIQAADRIGAARLALSLPLDRYELAGVEVGAGNPQWLALDEVLDGRAVLGLIGLAPDLTAEEPETLELTLRLASLSGEAAGGEIALADLQASGRDGVTLDLSTAAPPAVPLPAPSTTMLLPARPNPFSGSTRLSLALARAAAVEVAVHDLSGRRVATLFHGSLPAGTHEFTWNGTRADGSAAAHGVYFVQARINGARLSGKLILLRGE
jgi:hypothetical protein